VSTLCLWHGNTRDVSHAAGTGLGDGTTASVGRMFDAVQTARDRVGKALRDFGHTLVGHHVTPADLDTITSDLDAAASRIVGSEVRSRDNTGFHDRWPVEQQDGDLFPTYGDRPFSGTSSPWSVEPEVRRDGPGVRATVTFHAAHEGAPGRCHGGIVAGLFDDLMGSAVSVHGVAVFTGELTIRYVAGVPLHRELVMLCRVDRVEGRKYFATGELLDGDEVITRATALFIQPRTALTQTTFDPT